MMNRTNFSPLMKWIILIGLLLLPVGAVKSQNVEEDILNTKHNLSATPPVKFLPSILPKTFDTKQRNVFTAETTEICVFCHTPHGASLKAAREIRAPIWNRNLSTQRYTMYDQVWSKSFEGKLLTGQPSGFSRLCLACHDGTIALGSVINKPGSGGFNPNNDPTLSFTMQYPTGQRPATIPGTIPSGSGPLSGDTRDLGTNLTNDHAISFVFDSTLAAVDTELVNPGPPPGKINDPTPLDPEGGYQAGAKRAEGNTPGVFNSVQCTSCHNPHAVTYPKFLRAPILNRASDPSNPGLNHPTQQIICFFCHDKPGFPTATGNQITSTHNDSQAVHEPYPNGNPYDFDGEHSVAEYACRNCHDPHTAQGAKRLHREGVDNAGQDAIENTCFLCHSPPGTVLPAGPNTGFDLVKGQANGALIKAAPDIWTQFAKDRQGNGNFGLDGGTGTGSAMDLKLRLGHEPVFTALPREGVQLGSDNLSPSYFGGPFSEPANNKIDPENAPRTPDTSHIECTDCHNMHRVVRRNRFKGMPGININGGIVAETLTHVDERREPYIFEVCLRCHGNTFNNHVKEQLVTATGTGKLVQARGDNYGSVAPGINPSLGVNASGSNKRKEFNPDSQPFYRDNFLRPIDPANPSDPNGGFIPDPPTFNTAFHPVADLGRNQSGVLNNTNQGGQLLGLLSRQNTIQCTDCHNTDLFGTFNGNVGSGGGGIPMSKVGSNGFPFGFNVPDFPGPITYDDTQGLAFRRVTDLPPSITDINVLNDPAKPQGPHGSKYKRILRANYDTTVGDASNRPLGGCTSNADNCWQHYNPQNFALCFNCHNEAAFTTPVFPSFEERLTNFYREGTTVNVPLSIVGNNLHYLHLLGRTNARCHECHNNVHSNVEAGNTIYIGLNDTQFKIDNPGHEKSTHLINFQPGIGGSACKPDGVNVQPCWGDPQAMVGTQNLDDFNGLGKGGIAHRGPGCNLRCHNFDMHHNTDAHPVINGMK
jgi:predicted CXXCH cytochrome family protein